MKTQAVERRCEDRRQYDPDFVLWIDRRYGNERRSQESVRADLSDAALGISDSVWKMLVIPKKYWRD
jgi:hypothetical protein